MTIDSYSYGTEAGCEQKAGWVVPDRDFDATSVPSDTEVHNIIDTVASEIHQALAEAGYPIQTKSDVTTNAPRAVKWLEQLNELGAAADIIQNFGIAGDPEDNSRPAGYWRKRFEDGLKRIRGGALSHLGLSRDRDLSAYLVGTSYKNTDGDIKKPFFKRGQFNAPGSTALTED